MVPRATESASFLSHQLHRLRSRPHPALRTAAHVSQGHPSGHRRLSYKVVVSLGCVVGVDGNRGRGTGGYRTKDIISFPIVSPDLHAHLLYKTQRCVDEGQQCSMTWCRTDKGTKVCILGIECPAPVKLDLNDEGDLDPTARDVEAFAGNGWDNRTLYALRVCARTEPSFQRKR